MNKIFLHLWLLALGSLILHSCTKNETLPEVECPENEVRFQTKQGTSRSFIEGNLSTEDTAIEIYGYHNDDFLEADNTDRILNGKSLTCLSDGSWNVVDDEGSPITYYWTDNGTYRFFGWLTYDAASDKRFPFTPSFFNDKLSITAKVSKDYNQFDFMYSMINHRRMTAENFNWEKSKPVSMEMNHLFSAFAIGIRNTSEDAVVIKSVSLNCIHDMGSVEIDYNKNITANGVDETTFLSPGVRYGDTSKETTGASFSTFTGEHTLARKTGYSPNIFNPTAEGMQFYMVWPQSGDVLNATDLTFADEEAEAAADDKLFPMVLVYESDGVEYKKRIRLPEEDWEPGNKYYLEVQIADKLIDVTTRVMEWDYTDVDVDFSENVIMVKENGHLQWDEGTCLVDDEKEEVYVTNGAPVEATFAIDAPQGGQWRVSLEGDVTAFTIMDDAVPTDDGFGPIDGKVHRIKIVPTVTTPNRDYRVTLKFVAITADHKTYPADDMLQDSTNDDKADIYTIVLPSVK